MSSGLSISSFLGTLFAMPVDASGVALSGSNWEFFGDARLELQQKATITPVKGRTVAMGGKIIASKAELDDAGGSLTLNEWNAQNLAWFFSGSKSALTGTSGTWTGTSATAPLPGQYLEFGHRGVSSIVITSDPAGTTYVNGTDYEYNAALGLWTTKDGGALAAGTVAVLHSGSYAAQSNYRIEIGTQAQIRVAIKGELYNEFSGLTHTLELDCVQLAANNPVNLVSEAGSEGEKLQFDITPITVNGTSPGRIDGVPL